MQRTINWMAAGVILVCAALAPAAENETEDLRTTIEALKAKLRDQENRLAELEDQQAAQKASMAKIAKDMADSAASKPAGPNWLENLKFAGDLRLRFQNDRFSGDDRPDSKPGNRARFRLRFGLVKTWLDDQMEVGFRLASGSDNNPTSTNQTFETNFEKHPVWIDRAYAKYEPRCAPGLTAMAGKMGVPLVNTDLIWDNNVNPEGAWVQYKPRFSDVSPFANVGMWSLSERVQHKHGLDDLPAGGTAADYTLVNATLMTYQAGVDWQIEKDVKWTTAATYYQFGNYDQTYSRTGGNTETTVPLTSPLGATTSYKRVSDFRMINLTNQVSWKLLGQKMAAYFDIVHNCGDNVDAEDYRGQDNGYAAGLKVGENKKKGDWSVAYKYAWIEANCTPGGFNDSDFGGSNRKGHSIGGTYNLTDDLTIGAAVFLIQPIAGPDADADYTDTTTKFDLVWKF
jgi:hypothetical protein